MDDKLVTLEKYDIDFEAQFAKNALEENGIKAMVVGHNLPHISPYHSFADTAVIELKVFECDVDKAKEILKSQQNTEPESFDE